MEKGVTTTLFSEAPNFSKVLGIMFDSKQILSKFLYTIKLSIFQTLYSQDVLSLDINEPLMKFLIFPF